MGEDELIVTFTAYWLASLAERSILLVMVESVLDEIIPFITIGKGATYDPEEVSVTSIFSYIYIEA